MLCTLGLSVIPAWTQAYQAIRQLAEPGGRVAIMDADYPPRHLDRGRRPPPVLAVRLQARRRPGRRQPWLRLANDIDHAVTDTFSGGYVGVSAGTARC